MLLKSAFKIRTALNKLFNNNKTVNWNETVYISSVKNQGSCGSCLAFATTSALEVFMRHHNYSVTRLSEQQLVDCSTENFIINKTLLTNYLH